MTQFSLFGNEAEPTIIPIQDGDLRYLNDFLTQDQADHYFAVLRDSLDWQQDYIQMYGKRMKVPRLQAWYGSPESAHDYTNMSRHPQPMGQALNALRQQCEQICQVSFNGVLANYYRDGQDSVAWHADDEPELHPQPLIASVSLGEARDFDLRHNITRQRLRMRLEHGSLLIMAGTLQQYWQHTIAKSRTAQGARINLTYRYVYGPTA